LILGRRVVDEYVVGARVGVEAEPVLRRGIVEEGVASRPILQSESDAVLGGGVVLDQVVVAQLHVDAKPALADPQTLHDTAGGAHRFPAAGHLAVQDRRLEDLDAELPAA
jgi:hypothetical protein